MKSTKSLLAFAFCLPVLLAFDKQPIRQGTAENSHEIMDMQSVSIAFNTLSSTHTNSSMTIGKEIIIDKNIESAWQVLGPQFAEAYKWASAVKHSEGSGPGLNGATCSERGCSTTMGALKEKLLKYSNTEHMLSYEVAEGMPSMVKYATNTWQLTSINANQTRLNIQINIQVGGLMGTIMKPMMRMKMSKMGDELVEEFKYYVEKGQPHPRKVKNSK
jgi:Polyketide cyclase / dehydrase and lipid transport